MSHLQSVDTEAVLAQYQAGAHIEDIKRQNGIGWDTIKKIVIGRGAKLRTGTRAARGGKAKDSPRKTRHVLCIDCGQTITANESWYDDGTGVRHLRDCRTQTLEEARRYSYIREIGYAGEKVNV